MFDDDANGNDAGDCTDSRQIVNLTSNVSTSLAVMLFAVNWLEDRGFVVCLHEETCEQLGYNVNRTLEIT